jgi:hypothetical protein
MQARFVFAAVAALWLATQLTLLGIANNAFEGPEDPQYYRNGLKYAQVLAAGQKAVPVRFEVPTEAHAGQPVTIGVSGAATVRVGRPATIREDRVLTVNEGRVSTRLPQGWWLVRAGDFQARFWVAP